MNISLPPEVLQQVIDLASRRRISQSAIIATAVTSFLSPDEHREAVFTRRLDRLTRQVQRLERNTGVTMEALALFVRFWLTVTPPLPPEAQAAMQAKGQQRYQDFVETLGRNLQKGRTLLNEIPDDVDDHASHPSRDDAPAETPPTSS